jgi:hypothetical protein
MRFPLVHMSVKRPNCHVITENIYYIPVNTTLWDVTEYVMCHVIVHTDSEMAVVRRSVRIYPTVMLYRELPRSSTGGSKQVSELCSW